MSTAPRSCRTCKYAIAPNAAGCLCGYGNGARFNPDNVPCSHYRTAPIFKDRGRGS